MAETSDQLVNAILNNALTKQTLQTELLPMQSDLNIIKGCSDQLAGLDERLQSIEESITRIFEQLEEINKILSGGYVP